MKSKSEKLHQQMQILQQRYTESLPERIQQVETLWQQVVQGEDQQALEQLLQVVHNLTGSGSIYGHPRISELAGELESILIDLQHASRPSSEQRERVEKSLLALRLAAKRAP